jgi:hypothetical protein
MNNHSWREHVRALVAAARGKIDGASLRKQAERVEKHLSGDKYDVAVRAAVSDGGIGLIVPAIIARCKAHYGDKWRSAAIAQVHHICKTPFPHALVQEFSV